MEPTRGDYDITEVDGFESLREALRDITLSDDPVDALADLLMNGHEGVSGYLNFGNNKVAKNTGIFNLNSATDCPNADSTEEDPSPVGVCQVPWAVCYAHKAESQYDRPLAKRRLQAYLWRTVDSTRFAKALLRVKERKRSAFDYLRVSEAGDFRHNGDIAKMDRVAEIVSPEIEVYTYSASHKLNWSLAENFVVNQSNALAVYGDREFTATIEQDGETVPITEPEQVPDDVILCPFEAAKVNGVETDKRPKCGDCTACIEPESEQPRDVAIIQH